MFCVNCGKQIVDTARFCNYCGMKVVNFDENFQQGPEKIPENPMSVPAEDVKIPENVENSVDLLKMQNDVLPDEPLMNEQPEAGDTPFSEKETGSDDIKSGAVGAQRGADAAPAPEISDMQLDVNIPISQPVGQSEPVSQSLGQSPTGAIPGQLPISTTPGQPEQSASVNQPVGQPEPISQPAAQPERRYTIGHIIMCLASTALMAIVAGVFAGLYFSVV